ncbi:MAG: outer membrane protein assembly factor BamD [Acidobacteriota bacterium]|nr:outer membrane protein assembly factor BamD [Acidobacteriota bacterium]
MLTKRENCVAALLLVVLTTGCGKGVKDDPILRLSAAESLAEGRALMEQEKYARARDYLIHAFEVEPNSAGGREALLMVADAHFLQGGNQNFIKAEAKYRDFQNRFPTSDRAAYVQFQIAKSLASRTLSPDRDQSSTRKALDAYEDVIRLFPTSENVEEARQESAILRATLAESEFVKGHFNLKRGLLKAAIARFEYLLETFPEYQETDKVLYYLAEAYEKSEQSELAHETVERLRSEHPQSEYVAAENKESQG